MRTYKGYIKDLPANSIFVFGSNTQGRHGKGSAKVARDYFGAEHGNPKGRQGKSYAIITKDLTKTVHPSISEDFIKEQIRELYSYALKGHHLDFYVAYSGTGTNLNGYSNEEMAKMFAHATIPENIIFEESFCDLVKGFIINDFIKELDEKFTK